MKSSKYTLIVKTAVALLAALFMLSTSEAAAQYFSFGKNRVQYADFDWKYIQSEHFDVYYYDSKNYSLANFTAVSLEASLRQIHEDFRHQIADRIQVIIYDSDNDFAQTNVVNLPVDSEGIGGVTDLFKNRITMPFSGNYTEFRSTLQHELVHAVINDMFYGGSAQALVSGRVRLQIPLWFNEGLSEYISSGWDTNTDMWVRDAIINNYLPDISQLGGYLAYRGGQSIWNFIVEEYGRQKIGEIMQAMLSQRNLEAAFRRSLGLSIEELNNRWKDFYRERYFPEVAERENIENFSNHLTERGKRGTYNTSPAVSPQGDKIAMITNERGFLDVVVISAVTGEKLKTIIKGGDNINFEELNILNPNLSWSPDGQKLTLSTKSKGADNLAIVDYETGNVQRIEFPRLDAMGSVAWSPDGTKIAFDGNVGPYQDIFVYNVETRDFSNVTSDAISDYQPAWSADSQTIYFTSARGDNVNLNEVKNNEDLLAGDYMYSTDIYSVTLGSDEATRLTSTPLWNEKQPITTQTGELLFISDQNGIQNVYRMNLKDRTSTPLTNLQTGVLQMSVSADGSRLAVNTINEGFTDIFLMRSPLSRAKDGSLSDNQWAERRVQESQAQRVPATGYVREILASSERRTTGPKTPTEGQLAAMDDQQADTIETTQADTVDTDTTDSDEIDFRNYVFDTEVTEDTVFTAQYMDEDRFEPENNKTEDGRYQPKEYRLKFSTDIAYAGGTFTTTYGSSGLTQIIFSDLLGNHQIAFGTNLVFDLRNSNYSLQYGYFENRTNWLFNFFHSAFQFQTFTGQLYRFRNYGGGITGQYPLDKFRRIDFSLSGIGLAQDITAVGANDSDNETSEFLYPRVTYTKDVTLPGFLTPRGGSRYAISLSGSPPITSETLQFASVLGDYRKYFNLGRGYSFALRGSGAASYGRDSQTFFMGGTLGWINQRFSGNSIPIDRLGDTFFTQPALPLRGHEFNAISGDRFALANAEFRFPLFAAILPGPIPVLPLYNITGVAFLDAGAAWGERVNYTVSFTDGSEFVYGSNDPGLDFQVREEGHRFLELDENGFPVFENGEPVIVSEQEPGTDYEPLQFDQGDILMGAGFGLRTIVFGLPLRYDVGWPYFREGFADKPIHYISIGVDF